GYFPVRGGGGMVSESNGNTANSLSTQMVTSGVANTKGAYTQMIASTARHYEGAIIRLHSASATSTDFLVDVAVGAGGSEVIVFPDLHMSCISDLMSEAVYFLPIPIPAGTRISARQASNSTTATIYCMAEFLSGSLHGHRYGRLISGMGTDAASSSSTLIAQPGANNTKGAYTQLVASTAHRIRGLIVHFGKQQAVATQTRFADVSIGGAGSEVIIIPNIGFSQNSTASHIQPWNYGPFFVDIPQGTRLSMRYQQDVTGTGRDVYAQLYGLV
ncbi:MAG: hypothetical protein MN733_09680, partial [Nitrososphaera sp.]|nr:hypothetical protein [Nitrososphaera sp.]